MFPAFILAHSWVLTLLPEGPPSSSIFGKTQANVSQDFHLFLRIIFNYTLFLSLQPNVLFSLLMYLSMPHPHHSFWNLRHDRSMELESIISWLNSKNRNEKVWILSILSKLFFKIQLIYYLIWKVFSTPSQIWKPMGSHIISNLPLLSVQELWFNFLILFYL